MKRSPLKRKTPLRARKPMRRSPAKRKQKLPAGPHPYITAVHELPCVVAKYGVPWCAWFGTQAWRCSGIIEADHMGDWNDGRGTGRTPDDTTCAPLCRDHHSQRHRLVGVFFNVTKVDLQVWRKDMIARTRAEVYARYPELSGAAEAP